MDLTKFVDSLVGFLIPALITLGFTLLAHWILTNWKIRRELRLQLLAKTFDPLYKRTSAAIEWLEQNLWISDFGLKMSHLSEIRSDIKFGMLKKSEQKIITDVDTVRMEYNQSFTAAANLLRNIWEDKWTHTFTSIKNPIDEIKSLWAYVMDNSFGEEDRILGKKISPDDKKKAIELLHETIKEFKASPECKNYLDVSKRLLALLKKLKESLMKWADRMFSLTSR